MKIIEKLIKSKSLTMARGSDKITVCNGRIIMKCGHLSNVDLKIALKHYFKIFN